MNPFDQFDNGDNPFNRFDEAPKRDPKIGQPEELTLGEKLMSGVSLPSWLDTLITRGVKPLVQGAADPAIGAAQLVANALPNSTGIPQAVNKGVADENARYEAERKGAGGEGVDLLRLGGNVASPVNLAIASRLPAVAGALARAGQGALVGGGSGAMAPVENTDNGFWSKKAAQTGLGAVTGAALTPVLGKIADYAVQKLGIGRANVRASDHDIDSAVFDALKEAGQSAADVPPDQLAALRAQVQQSLTQGTKLDTAAALRKADFEALNMQPTLGQITREPGQFAREQNLRGVEGVGDELLARLQTQGNQLQTALPAGGGKPAYQAGTQLSESLGGIDDTMRRHVSGLYGEARASAGRELDVPLQGFAQDYADILHRYGDKVPSGVRNVLNDYGLGGGTQSKVFNFEEADKVLKAINANRSADPAVNNSLNELRGALRKTIESTDSGGGPFAPAVKAASERFKMHDAIPALKAAADGSVAPDDFVRRFVVGGKTNDVKGLAQVLKQADPASFQEARAQLADELRRAAFGENAAGDAPFASARYMAAIRRLGPDKLGAFFTPQEVMDIMRVGRVGTYIKQAPNASAVNNSNTAGALMNLASKVPGMSPLVTLGNRAVSAVKNGNALKAALAAEVPSTPAAMTPDQENWLAYILAAGGLSAGGLAGRSQ